MAYNINFQALALWIGLAAVVGGGYFVVSSGSSSQQTSFNIGVEEDTVPGELTRLSVENNGEPVQGANISIDGEFIGTTNSQGIKGFETPENNFTVEASKGDISSETTFIVEDGSFSSPDDSEGSDGDGEDEDSSDGSDSDDEDSSDGSDNDSEDSDNQDSNQDSSEDDQQDSSDTVDDFTGIELDEEPMIGELRTLTVYDTGEKVSGAEVTVNGEIVGTTNAGGTVTFGVPNAAEVSVSTDTGLSETFTVQDYTEDDQNQTDDQNDTEEDLTTGIELDSDPVSGTNNRIILYDQGDRVSGETVYLDGNELGQTGSNGAIEFEVPLQEQITVSTDYDLQSETFNVTEDHPEPDITLLSPDDGSTFDTVQGETTDIDFEASVEITENTGTASIMIDGSEAYTQDLSQGENTISATQALSGGTHDWSIGVGTQEHDVSSAIRSLTVNEAEIQNGIEIQGNITAEEYATTVLYQNNEPVENEEIFVNDKSIGVTDAFGELEFQIPNTQEITVTTESNIDELTRSVNGYNAKIANFNFISPEKSSQITGYSKEAVIGIEAMSDIDYRIESDGEVMRSSTLEEGESEEFRDNLYFENSGTHTIRAVAETSEDTQESSIEVETTEDVPPINVSLDAPGDGAQIDDYWASFNYGVESAVPYIFELDVNGETVEQAELDAGQELTSYRTFFNTPSQHTWGVTAKSTVTNQEKSSFRTFETLQEAPLAEIALDYPMADLPPGAEDFQAGQSYYYMFSIDVFENTQWELYLVNESGSETLEFEGTLDRGQGQIVETGEAVWDAGNYEWYVTLESLETGKNITTNLQSFEVVP